MIRKCNLCSSKNSKVVKIVTKRPAIENDYGIAKKEYFREICFCKNCGGYFNHYKKNLLQKNFYKGFYNNSIKSKHRNLLNRFRKIINLPLTKSDNKNRANRIHFLHFLLEKNKKATAMELLDVGSGTGVFSYEMSKKGYNVSCVDPDPAAIDHIKKNIAVKKAWAGTIKDVPKNILFNLITCNKVIEHIDNPIETVRVFQDYLKKNGIIYIEVPFGEEIVKNMKPADRPEFVIDHLNIFTRSSFRYLAKKCELNILFQEAIIDPSGKNTIFALLKRKMV